jgi:hypothetical protein
MTDSIFDHAKAVTRRLAASEPLELGDQFFYFVPYDEGATQEQNVPTNYAVNLIELAFKRIKPNETLTFHGDSNGKGIVVDKPNRLPTRQILHEIEAMQTSLSKGWKQQDDQWRNEGAFGHDPSLMNFCNSFLKQKTFEMLVTCEHPETKEVSQPFPLSELVALQGRYDQYQYMGGQFNNMVTLGGLKVPLTDLKVVKAVAVEISADKMADAAQKIGFDNPEKTAGVQR